MKLTMFNIVIRKKILVAVMLAYLQLLKNTKTLLPKFSVLRIKSKFIQSDSVSLGLYCNSAKGTILMVEYFEELPQEYTSNQKAENSVITYFFYETKETNIRLRKSACFGNIIRFEGQEIRSLSQRSGRKFSPFIIPADIYLGYTQTK